MNLQENIQRIKKMMGLLVESVKDIKSILKLGSKGSEVEIIQDILGIYKDGRFGPQTKKCVQEFQNKVSIKDDGIVGDETKTKLKKLEDNKIEWETPKFCKTLENFNSDSDSKEEKEKETITSTEVNDSSLKKYNFHKIPMGTNNYRSAQIPIDLLESLIKKYNIKNIIRLNGETGNDGKHRSSDSTVKIQDEKKVCEDNDCEFNKISAHDGYVKGKGYQESINKVISILNKGNTLIHCAHGADRTGGLVGAYLKEKGYGDNDKIWDYTTKYNSWEKMSSNEFNSGYHKYAECFMYDDKEKKSSKLTSDNKKQPDTYKFDPDSPLIFNLNKFKNYEIKNISASSTFNSKKFNPKYFILHHTAGRGKAEDIVNILNNRNLGIHWVIDRAGNLFQTLPLNHQGAHIKSIYDSAPKDMGNKTAEGVEIIANNNEDILEIQCKTALFLVKKLGYTFDTIYGHGEVSSNRGKTEGNKCKTYIKNNW